MTTFVSFSCVISIRVFSLHSNRTNGGRAMTMLIFCAPSADEPIPNEYAILSLKYKRKGILYFSLKKTGSFQRQILRGSCNNLCLTLTLNVTLKLSTVSSCLTHRKMILVITGLSGLMELLRYWSYCQLYLHMISP